MQSHVPPAAAARTPAFTLRFDGIGATGDVPPDPIGDVGPNHYVQMANTKFAVFDKSGGLLTGPTSIHLLFSGLPAGNQCVLRDDGDPVVLYDRLADRWLLSQMAVPGGPSGFHVCIAVSQTPDPTGSYFLYDVAVPVFPDYFKIGVWPDGYYMSTNEDTGTVGVFVLDRSRMLQGLSASTIRFVVTDTNFLLPSSVGGVQSPPAGAPNYFYTFTDPSFWGSGGVHRLDLFAFHADFATPANSTFTALPVINITAFNYTVCGPFVFNCIPQPSPGEKVDAVSEWPMWRFSYRNMKTHESLVGNFTVDVTGTHQAGIRWFELRKSGGGIWTLFQEGTHAPDANHRWMGSIAMDANGNIALGYSVSSTSLNPSLRYATRLAGAALGTLEPEAVLVNGGGVQTNGSNRWGDYSAMSVDPADECTFWYTGEYYASTSAAGWRTHIGAFKIPSCTALPPPTAKVTACDFDGDGIRDFGVFRPSTAEWFILGTATGSQQFTFGAPASSGLGDTPVPADFDGDGKTDPAVYRKGTAEWLVFGSATGLQTRVFGAPSASGLGDLPVPADFDGDGKADLAIYRQATGEWFIFGSATGFQTRAFGAPASSGLGDTPVPGDFDGDGKADLALFRGSTGQWFVLRSSDGQTRTTPWGAPGDLPLSCVRKPTPGGSANSFTPTGNVLVTEGQGKAGTLAGAEIFLP